MPIDLVGLWQHQTSIINQFRMSGAAVDLLAKHKGRRKEEISELEAAFRKADAHKDGKVIKCFAFLV